jgi:hypothetical protein
MASCSGVNLNQYINQSYLLMAGGGAVAVIGAAVAVKASVVAGVALVCIGAAAFGLGYCTQAKPLNKNNASLPSVNNAPVPNEPTTMQQIADLVMGGCSDQVFLQEAEKRKFSTPEVYIGRLLFHVREVIRKGVENPGEDIFTVEFTLEFQHASADHFSSTLKNDLEISLFLKNFGEKIKNALPAKAKFDSAYQYLSNCRITRKSSKDDQITEVRSFGHLKMKLSGLVTK